jgi:uncharacterized protein YutE (UPF0331/DUF86 family)
MLSEKYKKSLLAIFDKSHQTIKALETTLQNAPNSWNMTVCAGAGTLLGNIYMSVENILRLFIESIYGEKTVKDESWHKHLVDTGNEKGLLPLGINDTLHNIRSFRHRLMHGYGIDMDESKLRKAIPEAIAAYEKIEAHILMKYPELVNKE